MNEPLKPDEEYMTTFREERCTACPFKPTGPRHPQVFGETGPKDEVKLILVGEAPGETERIGGRPFTGRSGMLLRAILVELGIPSRHVFITNVCKCQPPENKTPTKKEAAICFPLLEWELDQFQQVPVVALGKTAANMLLNNANAIGRLRGGSYVTKHGMVFPTYHPAAVLRNPHYRQYIVEDLKRALSGQVGTAPINTPKFYVGGMEKLKQYSAEHPDSPTTIVLDVETGGGDGKGGLSPKRADSVLRIVGVKLWGIHETYALCTQEQLHEFRGWLDERLPAGLRIVGHNTKYEFLWMLHFGAISPQAVLDAKVFDTLINYNHVDEDAPSKGLKALCTSLFNVPDWSVDFEKVSFMELVEYNAIDLWMTERLAIYEHERGVPWKLSERGTYVTTMMEHAGMKLDLDALEKLHAEYAVKVGEAEAQLTEYVDNPRSVPQLRKLLYDQFKLPVLKKSKQTKAPSTDEETINRLLEHNLPTEAEQFLRKLKKYKKVHKVLSTYIEGYQKHVNGYVSPDSGVNTYMYPSFNASGTVTGRLASSGPNMQNAPPKLLSVFTSRFEGGELWYPDLGQIELRVLAHYSQDPALLEIYANGEDLHARTVERIVASRAGELDRKEQRTVAKRVNFGIAYKISPKGLVSVIFKDLQIRLSQEQASDFIDLWYRDFPRVAQWQTEVEQFVAQSGYVDNMFGRIRHLPGGSTYSRVGREVLRQGVNFPIQSTASDIMVYGIMPGLIGTLQDNGLRSQVLANIHDALIIDVHPDEFEAVKRLVHHFFSDPPVPTVPVQLWSQVSNVPITYSIEKIGVNVKGASDG